MTAGKSRRAAYITITTHVPREVALAIQEAAHDRGISVSAATAQLLAEALRLPLERELALRIRSRQ